MKIATWNVNSLAVRLPQLLDWLSLHQPDVLCLQETKLTDDKFPHAAIMAAGYQVQWFGQKTYNGVALISKSPATDVVRNIPGHDDPQARVIAATVDSPLGRVRIIGVYIPNGQAVESEKFPYKLAWLSALRDWVQQQSAAHPQLALLGDYNIAPEDRDVHDPKAWEGQNLVSPEERAHFVQLIELGLTDTFRMFEQPEKLYTWWDYRMLGFRRNAGLRIDHILVTAELAAQCTACEVDKVPRKWEQPSDHAPVIATIAE